MEIIIGFGILFTMWLIGKMMDSKIENINQSKYQKSLQGDPIKIVTHLKQELKDTQIDLQKANLIGSDINTTRYHQEYCRLLEFAQLLAIDLSVNSLDVRGPLFQEYKKDWPPELQTKYSLYKKEFTSTGKITSSFIESIGATPNDVLFADASVINSQFAVTHRSALGFLRIAGLIGNTSR